MPHFCATIKVLIEDTDLARATLTCKEAFDFLVEQNTILDWGYSLKTPYHATGVNGQCGPMPRLVNPELAQYYEETLITLMDLKADSHFKNSPDGQEKIATLTTESEELFHKL